MSVRKFHKAVIIDKHPETSDSVVVTLRVDADATGDFHYTQGQHLPVRAEIGGSSLRRTYSICASAGEQRLRLGVRVQEGGQFSNYIANELNEGDELDVMPPYGHFNTPLDPSNEKTYAAFVAGSGITPILSIVATTLETEPKSRFVLFYGNRKRATTMFLEELWALKNRFAGRLSLHFIMSQEPTDIELYEGRIDGARAARLHDAFLKDQPPDEIFICGPNPMIDDVTKALTGLGYPAGNIHSERFRAGAGAEDARRTRKVATPKDGAEVNITMDGRRQSFHMGPEETSIVDAAAAHGIDLPYSCKGGVCSTCRTKLRSGEVDMAINYALEPWELEKGFILACQSRPTTASIELDYDEA